MNKYFVNVKVDREERPDVDAQYMVIEIKAIIILIDVCTSDDWRGRMAYECIFNS